MIDMMKLLPVGVKRESRQHFDFDMVGEHLEIICGIGVDKPCLLLRFDNIEMFLGGTKEQLEAIAYFITYDILPNFKHCNNETDACAWDKYVEGRQRKED